MDKQLRLIRPEASIYKEYFGGGRFPSSAIMNRPMTGIANTEPFDGAPQHSRSHLCVAGTKMNRSLFNRFVTQRSRLVGCTLAVLSLAALGTPSTARAQNNTQRGATLGGITGAIAGAIIGDNNDEAGAGAAIGGAIGAVAGGMLGNAKDKDLAYQQQYYQSRPYATQSATPTNVYVQPAPTGAVSFTDVIAMSRSGVGESLILNQIAARGVQRRPVVSDIISLHQQGVSETVISAMQQARVGGGETIIAEPPPTIVETPVYVAPRPYPVPVYKHPRHHGPTYRARPNFHIHYGH